MMDNCHIQNLLFLKEIYNGNNKLHAKEFHLYFVLQDKDQYL